MKISIFVIIVILLTLNLYSQDLDSEIRNYKESDKVYISKARQFIADELRNEDLPKVRKLTDHLSDKFAGSLNIPFIPWEQFVLGLAVDSLDFALSAIDHIVEETNWEKYIFPEKDALYLSLNEILISHQASFTDDIMTSDLTDEQNKFMIIFLELLSSDLVEGIDQNTINNKCDIFLQKYPDSPYYDFIRYKIRNVWILGNWGYGFDLDVGYNSRDKDLGYKLRDGVIFGFSFYATYKRTALRMKVNIVSMSSSHDFVQNGDWEKGDHFNMTSYGFQLGYEIFESSRFKFEPHLFLGGSQIDFSEGEDKSEEILLPSWSYAPGISIYYKLSHQIEMEYRRPQNGYWYLSLNCDYLIPTFSTRYDDFKGNSLSISLGLGGYARPMVRDL